MYLSSEQVSISFKRLSSRKQEGKTHLERTSALMYFLAFDAVCKSLGRPVIDLDPDKSDGKSNRKSIELEFTKLVQVDRRPGRMAQVTELGLIDNEGKEPGKRISSNFLTVPLKKASENAEPTYYPRRPTAPIIGLGLAATGLKWGISYYSEWRDNLPRLFTDIKGPTYFTDLAIFVLRDTEFFCEEVNYLNVLSSALNDRFTYSLASFWSDRIEKEKVFVKHLENPFSPEHQPFGQDYNYSKITSFRNLKKGELIEYVEYLENLLLANKIEFKKI